MRRTLLAGIALVAVLAAAGASRGEQANEEERVTRFETKKISVEKDAVAPDGADVRVLLRLKGGSMAHFELAPGETSTAVTHKTVEEIWFVLSGHGQMWRSTDDQAEVVELEAGVSLTIPLGTHFQFRSEGPEPLAAIAVTMPPWPIDEEEAVVVKGRWEPTVP